VAGIFITGQKYNITSDSDNQRWIQIAALEN